MMKAIQMGPSRGLRLTLQLKPFRISQTLRWKLLMLRNSRRGVLVFTSQALLDRLNLSRVRKRKKAEPIPRNVFPHVVEKVRNPLLPASTDRLNLRTQGLVTETEARELYHMFAFLSPLPFRKTNLLAVSSRGATSSSQFSTLLMTRSRA